MKVIAIAQEKGGNCKSTTAVNFTALLNRAGQKALLIDADQQANATDTYHAVYENVKTLYDCLLEGENPMDCIQKTDIGDIIAGDPLLHEAKGKLESKGLPGLMAFKEMIEKIKGYKYVVIDCPPDMSVYLQSIFIASDEIIVPVLASRYSLMGINHLVETMENVKALNRKIKITGFLLCKFSGRTTADRNVLISLMQVAQNLGTRVFANYIRETSKVREAELARKLLIDYEPNCTASQDYKNFVSEYLEK